MQEKQLAVQGRENAAALALQQRRCAGIVSALQVHRDAQSPSAYAVSDLARPGLALP